MGRWIIASSIAATALAAWLVLEPSASPPSHWAALLLTRAPLLAFAFLAAYAGLILLAATAVVIIDLARVRSRLMQLKPGITRQTWNATFARTVLVKLTYRTLDLVTAPTAPPDTELVQRRFDLGAARREIAQLYWHCLTRVQFVTALALLCGILGIALTRDYLQLPLAGARLSASTALTALLTLGFLAACARLTVAVVGERLLDALERAPVERL
jgi:hypothetical protein